jgi:hypothetical protein
LTSTDVITTTAACDMGRCGSCRGVVLSLTDAHLTDCQHECHTDEPEPEEDDGSGRWIDLLIERDLEDAHFAEGWS